MNPALLSEELVKLSGEYERMSEERAQIEQRRPFKWSEIRTTASSVKDADMTYDRSEDGQRLIYLKRMMEAYEQKMSANRHSIQTSIAEMRHLNHGEANAR